MPIIVGSPRSGTTLLRLMLDAHPDLAIPPETGFLTLGPSLTGRGDSLHQRFRAAVTRHPADAPAWGDGCIGDQRLAAGGTILARQRPRRETTGRFVSALPVSREEHLRQQAATMLPLDQSRVGGSSESLTSLEAREFESIAGDALRTFGYPSAACQRNEV